MDPLSVTSSIITIIEASTKFVGYLNKIKDAPQDRVRCAAEILSLCSLLFTLRDHIEKSDSTKWYSTVQSLAIEDGPLDQFKQALETLHSKVADGGRLKRVGEVLMWKFQKEEIASILGQIERLKTLVEIALQLDHL